MRLPVQAPGADQGRVILDRPLVGEPQQRPAIVAERVLNLATRGLRPLRDRAYPGRRVLGEVLLHEGVLAAQHPDDRQRPVAPASANSGWSRLVSETPSRSSLPGLPSATIVEEQSEGVVELAERIRRDAPDGIGA